MRTISFRDGERMAWPLFRDMMLGQISPSKAVAAQRRHPEGAYDAALPKRRARDQMAAGSVSPTVTRPGNFSATMGLIPTTSTPSCSFSADTSPIPLRTKKI
jgi:hypothetical protein